MSCEIANALSAAMEKRDRGAGSALLARLVRQPGGFDSLRSLIATPPWGSSVLSKWLVDSEPKIRTLALELVEDRKEMTELVSHLGALLPDARTEKQLMDLLDASQPSIRRAALKGLAHGTSQESLAAIRIMLRSQEAPLRWEAVQALITREDWQSVTEILKMLDDPSDSVRRTLVGFLAEYPDGQMVKEALHKLAQDANAEVSEHAQRVLLGLNL